MTPAAIGVDLVDVASFGEQLRQEGSVFHRVFTAREWNAALRFAPEQGAAPAGRSPSGPFQESAVQHPSGPSVPELPTRALHSLAARWAAKEAFIKAWSSLYHGREDPLKSTDIDWAQIEVVCDRWGRPAFRFHGQTLGVLLVGAILGARKGALSLLSYMLLGLAGMPWFSAASGGLAALAKPSFGYILGFIPAAWLIGKLSERAWDRHFWLSLAAFGGATLIPFIVGIPYMWAVLRIGGVSMSITEALNAGFTPFIIGGIIKAAAGAAVVGGLWKAMGSGDVSRS